MTPKHEFEHDVKLDVETRVVREGVKAILEEVLQEEMSEHLDAGYREVLAVEVAGSEKGAAYVSLAAGTTGPGPFGGEADGLGRPRGHHKAAVFGELPGVGWQR